MITKKYFAFCVFISLSVLWIKYSLGCFLVIVIIQRTYFIDFICCIMYVRFFSSHYKSIGPCQITHERKQLESNFLMLKLLLKNGRYFKKTVMFKKREKYNHDVTVTLSHSEAYRNTLGSIKFNFTYARYFANIFR